MNAPSLQKTPLIFAFALLLSFLATACSWNRAQFHETLLTTDPDGTTHNAITDISHTNAATVGSRVEEGKGTVKYSGPDWSFALGNAAKGLDAADGTAILSHLLSLAELLAPLFIAPPLPDPIPTTSP
jgi:membrane protein implicated in regulation of membrane protease activity